MMDMTGGGGGSTSCPPVPNTSTIPGAADPHALANMLQERFIEVIFLHLHGICNCCCVIIRRVCLRVIR